MLGLVVLAGGRAGGRAASSPLPIGRRGSPAPVPANRRGAQGPQSEAEGARRNHCRRRRARREWAARGGFPRSAAGLQISTAELQRRRMMWLLAVALGMALGSGAVPADDPEDHGKHWVVIVAGSNGWYNYRHQADACHAYQIVHRNGIPDEQIVVMMYDDIAHSEE
ncbi:legumain [Erinaceus europaeus]|uniref:Legumain n=1 Tax=Erinaceus europaeus TaxID=9365 RepID=A0ABM3WLA0_ERIEU|nr:legumain [Erinaceus europaeus]